MMVSAAAIDSWLLILKESNIKNTILNTPPVVKISSPKANSKFDRNTMLSYSINVSDKEDGESKYQEISTQEVFFEIRYFDDSTNARRYLQKGAQRDHPGLEAIKRSDCFNCHQMRTKFVAPTFEEIGKRYSLTGDDVNSLARHIKEGISGIWMAGIAMPAHPDISHNTASEMVRWILQNAAIPSIDIYRGVDGTFWCKPVNLKSDGAFVLKASYRDHGTKENPESTLEGNDIIMIVEK